MSGKMNKLKIQSYNNPSCTGNPLEEIYALVNPESYVKEYNALYEEVSVIGDSAKTLNFSGMGVNSISINKLIVDGTGIVPLKGGKDVDEYLQNFQKTVFNYDGTLHAQNYIKLTWGAKNLTFKGVCTLFKVDYKLFNPDGSTLRAFIDITIKQSTDVKTKEMEAQKSSPDLTHIRSINAGDNLPLMVNKIYGNSSYYLQIAKANTLNSIYQLQPRDKLIFPPIKK